MPKRAIFERSRRELSLEVSVGVYILLVVEQSSLESQSRGGVPRLRYFRTVFVPRRRVMGCTQYSISILVSTEVHLVDEVVFSELGSYGSVCFLPK